MSKILLVISLFLAGSGAASAASYQYSCKLLTDYDNQMQIEVNSRTLKLVEHYSTGKTSTFYFKNEGMQGGRGKMKDRLRFSIDVEKSDSYSEINEYFLSPELVEGGMRLKNGSLGGFLSFAGHGYSWESYICFRD